MSVSANAAVLTQARCCIAAGSATHTCAPRFRVVAVLVASKVVEFIVANRLGIRSIQGFGDVGKMGEIEDGHLEEVRPRITGPMFKELIGNTAARAGVSTALARTVYRALVDVVHEEMRHTDRVVLPNLVVFSNRRMSATKTKPPRTWLRAKPSKSVPRTRPLLRARPHIPIPLPNAVRVIPAPTENELARLATTQCIHGD